MIPPTFAPTATSPSPTLPFLGDIFMFGSVTGYVQVHPDVHPDSRGFEAGDVVPRGPRRREASVLL